MPDNKRPTCFIDTNIWLYAFIEGDNSAKSATARALIQETEPMLSTQVINEVCVNLLRRANFTEEHVRRIIESFYEKYPVVELNRSILLTASQLRQQYSLSFWDSTIVASALSVRAPILYSEDMQHELTVEGHLQVLNPFAQR
ncbi:MAG: PIN domain nuclease [Deltaproteobacteria bacterium CG_4_8_14_3_um_filter_45_9]|jgi:predicted nucleic acid-binding protein|nr:MAG: PIN domain nuclease [Deltaproteobacteria bacterium CG03_land_8_20_14_0_80_45_14]PIX24599.1 MAG: PIN domain nuclease [Deltaproteobacteria bacterium CG_4_8_14_3_um_filter_45_9]